MAIAPLSPALRRTIYWQRVRRLTLFLLTVWFLVTFGVVFFARELSAFTFFGWPVSFYMAAQGTLLIYLAIVGAYVLCMRKLDRLIGSEGGDGR